MRTRLASIAALALFAISPAASGADVPSIDGLDAFVDGVLAEWKIPGMAVGVVRGGEVIHLKGYGFRDLEAKKPVTPKTLFAIGSISKSFAATGLGILVEYASGLGRREILERVRHLEPSHELRASWLYKYAATYEHPAYGLAEVTSTGDGPELAWPEGTAPRLHRRLDLFTADPGDDPAHPIPRVRVDFGVDAELAFARKAPATQRTGLAPFDLVILNGRVVDGTGNAWFLGDVAVRGDAIARVTPAGQLRDAPARRKVDASGLVVAPGFIDIQSHSREQFLGGDGRVVGKVTQGVTTEILGEGESNAPSRRFDGPRGFDAWLRAMRRHGGAANFGSFLGSQTVRSHVKGMKPGPPTPGELDAMRRVVRDAMKDGAFGLASALIYPPDTFVSTEDLIALAREMAPSGGLYITHMRSEADQLLEAIDEAIRVGREGGVPVEIYHLKAAGKRNWDKAGRAVEKINEARSRGLDIAADMYPYTAGGTGLTACLPPWASADGKLFENLADPKTRAAIREEVLHPTTPWENLVELSGPEEVLILGLEKPALKKYAGMRLSEIARAEGKPWVDTAMDLILAERQRVGAIYFMMSEENIRLQLRQPWIKFGTDAGGHDPEKPEGLVHPRSYGTFPRILGKYVREEGVLTLEDAIRKMTSATAARLSIRDRGLIREGFRADLVILDPSTIGDRATYESPHRVSVGVREVFVNGVAVIRDGHHTGALPGRIVRGPGYRLPADLSTASRSGGMARESEPGEAFQP